MAVCTRSRRTHQGFTAQVAGTEAEILKRLLQRPHSAQEVVGELLAERCMSESAAYAHVRTLLRDALVHACRSPRPVERP